MSRGILLVTYHFPPSSAVGGQRMANFAKNLPSLGWEPHVLTIDDGSIDHIDRGRLDGLEAIRIHKAGVLLTPNALLGILLRIRQRFSPRRSTDRLEVSQTPAIRGTEIETLSRRIRRYVLSFLILPDAENGWILPAILKGVRMVRRHRIDWVVTSCPPYSVQLVGLGIKKLTGTQWVADFRDPWMTADAKALSPTCKLSIGIESWLERKVVEQADLVVFNVDRLRDAYRNKYKHVPAQKFVFIPNGITPQPRSASTRKYETFTLTYTGSLYVGRSPEPIFRACCQLIQSGFVSADRIRIKLVGQCQHVNGTPISTLIRRYGLESVVEVSEPVSHNEALRIVQQSHLALLLAPGLPYQIPAKAYDYLGAGTRVIAIAEEGATADLVAQTGCGQAFAASDVEGIARFIRSEMSTLGCPHSNGHGMEALTRFDRRRITEELVGHFSRVERATVGTSR